MFKMSWFLGSIPRRSVMMVPGLFKIDSICDQDWELLDFNQSRSSIDFLMVLTQILLLKKKLYCLSKYVWKSFQSWMCLSCDTNEIDPIYFGTYSTKFYISASLWASENRIYVLISLDITFVILKMWINKKGLSWWLKETIPFIKCQKHDGWLISMYLCMYLKVESIYSKCK